MAKIQSPPGSQLGSLPLSRVARFIICPCGPLDNGEGFPNSCKFLQVEKSQSVLETGEDAWKGRFKHTMVLKGRGSKEPLKFNIDHAINEYKAACTCRIALKKKPKECVWRMRCRELWLRVTEREQREGYRPMHRSSRRQVRPSAMMRQAARPQPRENYSARCRTHRR